MTKPPPPRRAEDHPFTDSALALMATGRYVDERYHMPYSQRPQTLVSRLAVEIIRLRLQLRERGSGEGS
jgi:hypothetical protein